MINPKVYYRVLPTDGKIFRDLKDYYDGLVLEAHILEQYTKFAASLISTLEKPFFVDPTGKLALLNVEDISDKEWYLKIVDAFNLSECLQEGEILVDALEQNLDKFVESSISYQREKIKQELGGLALFGLSGNIEPEAVLTPYFLIDDVRSELYNLNLEILKVAIRHKGDSNLYAVIFIEENTLFSKSTVEKILSDFIIDGIDGVCVWVADFREYGEDAKSLKKYAEFFEKLSGLKRPVINLYGGAFSIFLGKLGLLDVIVQGIGYGEYRNPYSIPTGRQQKMYYIPRLRKSVPVHIAEELISSISGLECSCEYCGKGITDEIETEKVKKHYILKRWEEKHVDIKEVINEMNETIQNLEKDELLEEFWDVVHHLINWRDVLKELTEKRQ